MLFGVNICPKQRGTNPASGQKHETSFPLKFKKFSTVPDGQEFLQEASLHPGVLKASLEKNRIKLSWGHMATEMLLI